MRTLVTAGITLCALIPAGARAGAQGPAEYDIVIRHGRVLDGAGNPWIRADVAIKSGRFAQVGTVVGKGSVEIDASERYVSPGWIDMMDQSGASLLRNGLAENKLQEGVTTAIGGEGGFPVPAESIPAYWDRLKTQGISINFGSYFNEAQARVPLLGYSAREPTPVELDSMKQIMATAMQNGAMGMSTALIYPPLSYAKTPELIAVASVAGQYGGIYATHMRDEGSGVLDAIREAIQIGREGHLPVEIFHLKVAYAPGWGRLMPQVGALVDSAREQGLDIAADLYVYTAGGTGLEATIPAWAHEGGTDSLKARLARPDVRERLKREIREGSPGWWNIVEASGGWKNIMFANARNEENRQYQGRSLAAIAKAMHRSPPDAAFDLVAQGQGRVMAIYFMMAEKDIGTALRFPWTSIGSDAGASAEPGGQDPTGLPHPRAYGNFPRFLARYVRDQGLTTLPEGIRKITSWPATRMRLTDRGVIRVGGWADVVVFDYDKLNDRATYDHPTAFPEGIDYVVVNGQLVMDHGRHTGARPGMPLYGPGWQAPQAGGQVARDTASPSAGTELQDSIAALLSKLPAASTVYAKHLPDGKTIAIGADVPMNTASVIKIPVMVRAYRDAEAGRLSLDARRTVAPEDERRGSGLVQTFQPGLSPTYRDLITQMIITSDNTATDIMIRTVGLARVNAMLDSLGYSQTHLRETTGDAFRAVWELADPANRKLTDREIFERGFPTDSLAARRAPAFVADSAQWLGRTTAREISGLLEQIYGGKLANPEHTREMMGILRRQFYTSRLPRFVQDRASVAHKTGDWPPYLANDVGILFYPGGPTIVSVFSNQNAGPYIEVERAIGHVAELLVDRWR